MLCPCRDPKRPHGLGDIAASWLLFAGLLGAVLIGTSVGLEGLLSLVGSLLSLRLGSLLRPSRPSRSPS